jgi:UDP:flavonoid glycosyltransferase YjiC (YdhE family)
LSGEKLKEAVEEELSLYKEEKPDLVIGDMRITAKISTAVWGVPYVAITNTDMTKFYDYSRANVSVLTSLGRYIPEKPLRMLESRAGQKITRRALSILVRIGPLPVLFNFNRVCRTYHLPNLLSIFDTVMGDVTLLADLPEFRSTKRLPFNVFQVGPLMWGGGKRLPFWRDFHKAQRPIIYLTASGTGDPEVFRLLLGYLRGGDWTVVATVGSALKMREVSDYRVPGFFITDFLPAKWILPKVDMIIFPGGNLTAYQALLFGVPQIVIPVNVDQEDNANQLVRIGTGLKLNWHKLTRAKLIGTINRIFADQSFKKRNQDFSKIVGEYHGPARAANIVEGLLTMYET